MMKKISIETVTSGVCITGDISAVLSNRRASRLLKDTLDCEILESKIMIKNVVDLNHCLNRLNQIAQLCGCQVYYSDKTDEAVDRFLEEEQKFAEFSEKALSIRNNECNLQDLHEFKDALIEFLPTRTLYDLQLLSAYHLAFSQNACNFSVPGAGKTSVVYGAYAYLKNLPKDHIKKVDLLLIIGPLASFAPWELEYKECFGVPATSKRLTGQMSLESKKQYLYDDNPAEITLLSYHSVASLVSELRHFLRQHKVMVILDEAHKIKNTHGGEQAQAVLSLASECSSRVVLTGTPAPNGYEDLYNLFKFIWPSKKVIRFQPGQLRDMSKNANDYRVETLVNQISPYFMRVKKSDLNIPAPTIHPPIRVKMHDSQRRIYDFIESKYMQDISEEDSRFKSSIVKARMIRLMQAATNPLLLKQPLKEFAQAEGIDLSGVSEDDGVLQAVLKYSEAEVPAKFEAALDLIRSIISNNGKVVVWACYIRTIEMFSTFLAEKGIKNKILYGATPVASDDMTPESEEYEFTREAIVKEFNDLSSGLNVVIANPFAVAESISLHKACHNAIYIERSFNAAHFIQSKDRIHRYGLPAGTITNYYYLVSEDSIDETIDERLTIKENRLIEIMESMPIPLFSNVIGEGGDEDVKAVLKDYAKRIKTT